MRHYKDGIRWSGNEAIKKWNQGSERYNSKMLFNNDALYCLAHPLVILIK